MKLQQFKVMGILEHICLILPFGGEISYVKKYWHLDIQMKVLGSLWEHNESKTFKEKPQF